MLKPKQKRAAEMLASGNKKQSEIAKELKISEQTICNWKKDDDFIAEYNRLLKHNIQSLAAKAYKTQTALLSAKSEMVRYMVSKDILDRAGLKPGENLNITGGGTVVIVDDCDQ